MKNILLLLVLNLVVSQMLMAQKEGKISYSQTFKLDIQVEGLSEEMMAMIPKSQSVAKELLFSKHESVFRSGQADETENVDLSSDDGSFQVKIVMGDEVENILYKNLKEKSITHQKGIMGKAFLVDHDLEKIKWKITNEKVKYLEYECQKAVFENEEDFVVAWFTSQIPVQVGPDMYHGLPGAILLLSVNEDEVEFKATKINFEIPVVDDIKKPTKGKKVTQEEYEKIQKEKTQEMKEVHMRTESRSIGH